MVATGNLLRGLNKAQAKAVRHKDGPIQVLSCPGSGKTRVVTRRIAHLINEHGISPDTILAVTFTKKAANEMISRLSELIGDSPLDDLNIGTFHSACFKILRNEIDWYDRPMQGFRIIEGWAQIRAIRDVVEKRKAVPLLPAEVLSLISRAKNELLTPDGLLESTCPPVFSLNGISVEQLSHIYSLYEQHKRGLRLYDFDDLLIEVHTLLRDNEGIRMAYSGILDYYLIDEFHDTNKAQFEILRLLCSDDGNIMVVGDDDQSVFSWRGAVPKFTVQFKDYFPSATVIRMKTNYRSCPEIVVLANRLIINNKDRVKKVAVASRKDKGSVTVVTSPMEGMEAEFICKEIAELKDMNGVNDIAVLYRTNAQSRALEDGLVKAGIPYTIVGSLGFYNRKEVRDILAYLRVVEHDDNESLRRIINTPSRYLGKVFLAELSHIGEKNRCSLLKAIDKGMGNFSKPYMTIRARSFSRIIWNLKDRRKDVSPSQMVQMVRDLTEYDVYLASNQMETDPDNNRIQNLDELQSAAEGFQTLREFLTYANSMQRKGSVEDSENGDGRVELLTLHRSKGLEWDAVFIVGVSAGLLPHYRAESMEEERRLMYVGVTRSKNRLYISCLLSYRGRPLEVSRFLREMELVFEVEAGDE